MGKTQRTFSGPGGGHVYTRCGDSGETDSPAVGRVAKSHARVVANGAVDELNCALGELAARLEASNLPRARIRTPLGRIKRCQRELFAVGSLISGAAPSRSRTPGPQRTSVRRLEREIDAMERDLPPLTGFILPGGDLPGAAAHLARAVCRRAERDCVAASTDATFPREILPYLNRLADWLFVLARWLGNAAGRADEPWHERTDQRRVETTE